MEVILREDIEKLGNRGEVVKVAAGYARNFLLPKRLAVAATESNKKIVEQERQAHLRKEAKLKTEAEDLSKLMNLVKGYAQRLQQAMKKQQQQAGKNGDPAAMAKIQSTMLQARVKAQNAMQSHGARTAQKQVQFEQKLRQDEERHRADMGMKMREAQVDEATNMMRAHGDEMRSQMRSTEE